MIDNDISIEKRIIRPYRNIPFDIGHELNENDISIIKDKMANINYR